MNRTRGTLVGVVLLLYAIQRAWRDARVITLHGAINLEALSENYGRLMAGMQPHQFAGITTLSRFEPAAPKNAT